MKSLFTTAILASSAFVSSSHAITIIGTDFTGRTFSSNVVTVNDYTVNGVASPGNLTFTGPSSFMTSADATGRATPVRNPPNWSVLIPVNVGGQAIDLSNFTLSLESFNNGQATKIGVNGTNFAPQHEATVRLLNSAQSEIDSESIDAWTTVGNNSAAAWTPVFNFLSDDTLEANTNYFMEISMTGDGGNNVGIDSFALNGSPVSAIPEPSSLALFALGGLAILRRRR